MQNKLRETLRWIYLACYVGFSVVIYVTHLIQAHTPLALILFICLGCLVLVGFKATEERNKDQEKNRL